MIPGGLPSVGDVVVGKYRLVGVLGRGGMGIVFEGHHELLDRRVALKVLAPEVVANREAVTRFMNEARAAAKITSDRVVHVLDVGTLESGLPYMVMEKLEGVDLSDLLGKHGPLAVTEVVDLLVEAIEGVSHAHLEGIIHRDLKPSNLFLATRPDRTRVVKVLDFGISKLTGPESAGSVTSTSAILGSPLYMSPEQLRSSKSIDLRADIWSLGVIAYELLTQTLPFEAESLVELFAAIQARDARPPMDIRPEIPPGLNDIVLRCLQRQPEHRFSSAYAIAKALVPFGGASAAESVKRLESHLAAKGRSVDELGTTMAAPTSSATPGVARRPAAEGEIATSSPNAAAMTPPTMASGERDGGSTAAPWSSTGKTKASSSRSVAIATVAMVVAATAVGFGVLSFHSKEQRASDLSASASASASSLPSGLTGSSVAPSAMTTAFPDDAAVDAAAAASQPDPTSDAATRPLPPTSTRPKVGGSHGSSLTSAPPTPPTPPTPTKPAAAASANPMHMNAL